MTIDSSNRCTEFCLSPTMFFSPLVIGLLPLVSAGGIHKLKLHKIPPTSSNPALESAYLAEKYGASTSQQTPLMGAGGSGRHLGRPASKNGEPLFWTQESINGGHNVPLSSKCPTGNVRLSLSEPLRLHECAILYRDPNWEPCPNCKLFRSLRATQPLTAYEV